MARKAILLTIFFILAAISILLNAAYISSGSFSLRIWEDGKLSFSGGKPASDVTG
jgi:hypothetical protein